MRVRRVRTPSPLCADSQSDVFGLDFLSLMGSNVGGILIILKICQKETHNFPKLGKTCYICM